MSASICLRQLEKAFILTDAAHYFANGEVAYFADKCVPFPELHCAMTTFGPVLWSDIVAKLIQDNFSTFDALKAGIAPLLGEVFEARADEVTTLSGPAANGTEAWFVGWSAEQDMPAAFVVRMYDPEQVKRRFGMSDVPPPFQVDEVYLIHSPCPTQEQLAAAHLPFSLREISLAGLEQLRPETDLLHLLEIQRRLVLDGAHRVGGYAHLTQVDRHGITQRTIQAWSEDKAGELIRPLPIQWASWRRERERGAATNVVPIPTQRLNRHQRRQRKALGQA